MQIILMLVSIISILAVLSLGIYIIYKTKKETTDWIVECHEKGCSTLLNKNHSNKVLDVFNPRDTKGANEMYFCSVHQKNYESTTYVPDYSAGKMMNKYYKIFEVDEKGNLIKNHAINNTK